MSRHSYAEVQFRILDQVREHLDIEPRPTWKPGDPHEMAGVLLTWDEFMQLVTPALGPSPYERSG